MLITLKPSYYLGVDAGATHTEAVIANESGYVLGKGYSNGANLHNVDMEQACGSICEAIHGAEDQARSRKELGEINYDSMCVGMSGLDTPNDFKNVVEIFQKYAPDKNLKISRVLFTNDGLIGLKSGTESNFGICLVAGTGSNYYGLSRKGETAKAGDWGYILGDQSSAFAFGKAILEEVMKEYDGRKPRTELTDAVLKFLSLSDSSELVSWVYKQRVPVKDVASLSKLASDEEYKHIPLIAELISKAATAMIDAYDAIFHRLNLSTDEPIPVVFVGGLFSLEKEFKDKVVAGIRQRTPRADLIVPRRTPAEGAIRIAMMADYLNVLPDAITKIELNS